MSERLRIVATRPGEKWFDAFERLPSLLYAADSVRLSQSQRVNMDFLPTCFVAFNDDVPVGRAALYTNPHLRFNGAPAVCFGNYECVDDVVVSGLLINEASAAAAALGYTYGVGPMNGSTWDDYRFGIDNNEPNFFLEPCHHSYYIEQFLASGFVPIKRYVSFRDTRLTSHNDVGANGRKSALVAEGIAFRHIDVENFEAELRRIYNLSNCAFSGNFLFTSIGLESFIARYKLVKPLIQPRYFIKAEDGDALVGFIFAYKDAYDISGNGLVIKTVARSPQRRYYGLGNALVNMIYEQAIADGFEKIIHAFMVDDGMSKNISKKFAGEPFKRYVLYGKSLSR